jgi:predicted RNA binding protein YcfA (HicA-like mRNA interferase family)
MPRKVRQLKADLRRAGFVELRGRGKGDHSLWQHPDVPAAIVGLDGQDGDDARRYQEKDLREKIALVIETLATRERQGGI